MNLIKIRSLTVRHITKGGASEKSDFNQIGGILISKFPVLTIGTL